MEAGFRFFPRSNAPSTPLGLRPQGFTGGTSMSITTARQLVRQAEEARRAARELAFSLQNLRKQQLIG